MARKKRKSRKGRMPAALKRYWASHKRKGRKGRRGGRKSRSHGRRKGRRTHARRRAPKQGVHRLRVRYSKKRGWYQKSRRGLLKGHRVNPPLIPSIGSVTGIVRDGAFATAGWVGVNGVGYLARKFGLLGWAANQSPTVQALINTALRVLSVPVVAYVGGMVVKNPNDRRAMVLGASANAVYHGVRDIAGPSLPSWGNDLLMGTGDFLTMSDYVVGFGEGGAPQLTGGSSPALVAESSFA